MHYQRWLKHGDPARGPLTLEERFWLKVNKRGPVVRKELGPCWVWTGSLDRKGYGKLGKGGRGESPLTASRVAYELQIGPIPDDTNVCHKCDNPPCCRGSHLFLGSQAENLQDMASKGRHWKQNRTECPKGHPYPENARYYGKRKQLVCARCDRERPRKPRRPRKQR